MFMPGKLGIAAIGAAGMARAGGSAIGRLAKGGYGSTAAGAFWGGIYGGISNDTSILGGMGMGAAIGRYGGAGVRNMMPKWNTAAGMFASDAYRQGARTLGSAFSRGVVKRARSDIKGARMASNRAGNRIRGLWN